MRFIEKFSVVLAILGICLKLSNMPGGALLLALGSLVLSLVYFLFGFALFNGIPARHIFRKSSYPNLKGVNIIVAIVSGIIISCGLTAILFNIQQWPGSSLLRYLMAAPLLLVCIASIIMWTGSKMLVGKNVLIRALPVFLLDVFFILKYYFVL